MTLHYARERLAPLLAQQSLFASLDGRVAHDGR